MKITFEDVDDGLGPWGRVEVATGDDGYGPAGTVSVDGPDRAIYSPAQARSLAAALFRAADEAEGRGSHFTLKPVPEDLPSDEAREHMRTHVYVHIHATDRNADSSGYRRVGYRVFADRETWYGASDEARAQAVSRAVNRVANVAGVRPAADEAEGK